MVIGCVQHDCDACKNRRHALLAFPDIAIALILKDIRSRKGIGDEWDEIDVDIRNEIARTWRKELTAALEDLL